MKNKYKVDLFKCEVKCLESGIVYSISEDQATEQICKNKEAEMKKVYSEVLKEDFLKNKSMYNY